MIDRDPIFEAECVAYLAERGYKVAKARVARATSTTTARKLRKDHQNAHRTESVDGCPLCAFRADVRAHAGHQDKRDDCRFCGYEDRPRIFPSTLRRLPEQDRYNRTYRLWSRARNKYGPGHVREEYGGRVSITGHPRVAHLQAQVARLSDPSTWNRGQVERMAA